MAELNRFQKKRIEELIAGQEKDLDKLQQHIIDMALLHGLNNMEVASLLFSTMKNILSLNHNQKLLRSMNIKGPSQLGVAATLEIQKLLTHEYSKTLGKDGKPKNKGSRKK